jgi:hypothetical protein
MSSSSSSLRFLLLGIALILFGLAFQGPMESLLFRYIPYEFISHSPTIGYVVAAIFPVAGLILAFVGFFKRDR